MKKKILGLTYIIACFILISCKNVNEEKSNTTSSLPTQENSSVSPSPTAVSTDTNEYDVIRDGYNKGQDIAVSYPQIKGLDDKNRQNIINELLKQDAMSYLNDVSNLIYLEISYEIECKGNNLLSVRYHGWKKNSDDSYLSELFFVTNINMNTGNKIKLQDVFQINQNMIDIIIKNGDYVGPLYSYDPVFNEAVLLDISNNLTTSILPDITFYFTADSLGIKMDVEPSNGYIAMIETKYSDLKGYIDSDNEVWKDIEEVLNKDLGDLVDGTQSELSVGMTLSDIYGFAENEEQSFNVDLEKWGAVRFVSGKNYQGKLLFFLTDDKNSILYQFPDYYESYRKNQTVLSVDFRDTNNDGLKDIIIIASSDSGSTCCDIYFQKQFYFVQIPDLYHELNQSNTTYDTIDKVIDYMNHMGNTIVSEFWNE